MTKKQIFEMINGIKTTSNSYKNVITELYMNNNFLVKKYSFTILRSIIDLFGNSSYDSKSISDFIITNEHAFKILSELIDHAIDENNYPYFTDPYISEFGNILITLSYNDNNIKQVTEYFNSIDTTMFKKHCCNLELYNKKHRTRFNQLDFRSLVEYVFIYNLNLGEMNIFNFINNFEDLSNNIEKVKELMYI